jgi:hypothetical protein
MHPLTDAFIKGRAKFKKIDGKYFDNVLKPKSACHYGALYWGYFGTTGASDMTKPRLWQEFPELTKIVPMPCNDLTEKEGEIRSILIHLNDDHDGRSGWTDEKVAEWLENALTS